MASNGPGRGTAALSLSLSLSPIKPPSPAVGGGGPKAARASMLLSSSLPAPLLVPGQSLPDELGSARSEGGGAGGELRQSQAALQEARRKVATLERERTMLLARLSTPVAAPAAIGAAVAPSAVVPSNLQETALQLRLEEQTAENERLKLRLRRLTAAHTKQQAVAQRTAQQSKLLFSRYKQQYRADRAALAEALAAHKNQALAALQQALAPLVAERAALLQALALAQAQAQAAAAAAAVQTSGVQMGGDGSEQQQQQQLEQHQHQHQQQQREEARAASAELLAALCVAHADELASAQQLAHVKDLSRLAAHRETQLALDRAQAEAQFAREVHQILAFSCTAAENALAETAPAVVAKLAEGRHKRLSVVEQVVAASRRELDQRSRETVVAGAQQLAVFQAKAVKKLAACKLRTQQIALEAAAVLLRRPGDADDDDVQEL